MARDVDAIIQQKYAENGDVGLVGLELDELWTLTYSTPGGLFPSRLQFNQLFRYLSALGVELNQKGAFLDYSDVIDYEIGVTVRGAQGLIYKAMIANGPSSIIVNPIGDTTGTWVVAFERKLSDYNSLADAITDMGSDIVAFVIDIPFEISGSTSFHKNTAIKWMPNSLASGPHELTIPGSLCAGEYQLFDTDIIISASDCLTRSINVRWLGGVETEDIGIIINKIYTYWESDVAAYVPQSATNWLLLTTVFMDETTKGSHLTLEGDQFLGTTLDIQEGAAICGVSTDAADEAEIRNIRVIEGGATRVSACIAVGGTNTTLNNVWVGNAKYGIFQNKGAGAKLNNVYEEACAYGGYWAEGENDVSISGLPTAAGGISHTTIMGGLFHNNVTNAVRINQSLTNIIDNIKFVGCEFRGTGGDGVRLAGTGSINVIYAIFVGCYFGDNGGGASSGLRVLRGNAAVSGCIFDNNNPTAIKYENDARVTSVGNIFREGTYQVNEYEDAGDGILFFGDYSNDRRSSQWAIEINETLNVSSSQTLLQLGPGRYIYDGMTVNRKAIMPTPFNMKYREYTILNNDPTYSVLVQDDTDTTTVLTIAPGEWARIMSDGTNYFWIGGVNL